MDRGLVTSRLSIFAISAALLAGLLMRMTAPSTGEAIVTPQAPAPRPPIRPVRDLPARPPPARELPPGAPITRRPEPAPPPDPDQVFPIELKGLASAAVAQRPAWEACWQSYLGRSGGEPGYDGRLTVKITVYPDGEKGRPETELVNGPDDDAFYSCIEHVMDDTRFEAPDAPFSIMWPLTF